MPRFTGRWSGRLRDGSEEAHQSFVTGLQTSQSADLLRRCGLTRYALYQQGHELEVIFESDRPAIIAGFLRNRRLWPEFWEFTQPGGEDTPTGKDLVLEWTRP